MLEAGGVAGRGAAPADPEGRQEQGQGIAYLEDGTMVVVENAASCWARKSMFAVTSILQTTAGRLILPSSKILNTPVSSISSACLADLGAGPFSLEHEGREKPRKHFVSFRAFVVKRRLCSSLLKTLTRSSGSISFSVVS